MMKPTAARSSWSVLGRPDAPINLVTRTQGDSGKISGVGRMVRELIFKDPHYDFTPNATAVRSSGPLEQIIETDPLAIGRTGISSARRRTASCFGLPIV